MWYLKRDEDTFLLKIWSMVDNKLDEKSPVTENNNVLVEVVDVKACTDNDSEVEVRCFTIKCMIPIVES